MDDLIRREDAIDAVIAEGRTVDSHYLESERIIHVDDAVEAISMLPSAQPEQRWIPVTERLPKENKPVLVTHYGKYQAFVSVDWIDPYTSEWNRTCNVTAWQPLPKPWKGGEA